MEGEWGKLLHPLKLTSSGRPHFLDGEVESHVLSNVELTLDSSPVAAPPLKDGIVHLTSHRILWISEHRQKAGAISLAAISHIVPPKKNIKAMFSSPRVKLHVWATSEGSLSSQGHISARSTVTIVLILRGQSNVDLFVEKLVEEWRSKGWEATQHENAGADSAALMQDTPGPSRLNPEMAGVSGLLMRDQLDRERTEKDLHDAFQDLNALMGKAKEMVVLAEKMRSKLIAAPSGQAGSADEEGLASKQEMQDWLLSVGITSPVTKETAGALYHQQLSRQLADFVKVPLEKAGGTMALVDVYCLFNRARGTELISPEDLLQACTIWAKFDVPVMLRRFDSGVMAIQSKYHSDEEVLSRIRSLLMKPDSARFGVSASDAARALGMAPALAKEQLLAAECKGFLCRDDGPDGLRFFLNFFKEVEV